MQARATDANGLASVVERSVTNDFTPPWSEEVVAPLRVRDEPRPELTMALDKAGVRYDLYIYDGTQHAFNNDTSAARYNKAAADLAWSRTVALFREALA